MTVSISTPETPSTAAWCTFEKMANDPGGRPSTLSNPSITYASHEGRERSSGRASSRATWMHSCRQSPGFGSAMCRTWNSRSQSGSSIQ